MSKIAAFGEVMMRLQVPGYEQLSQANQLHYSFSGTGVNIAAALFRMGHEGYLVSTLPENPLGEAAGSYVRKLGIQTDFLTYKGNYIGKYFLENGFGIRPSRVTYTNRKESSFNNADLSAYPYEKIANTIDVVHFCGISLAMNEQVRQQMKALARAMKDQGKIVVFDCNYRPALWGGAGYEQAKPHYESMLELADIVMMNEKDALYTLGLKTKETERAKQLEELIPLVAEQYDIKVIAGTHRTIQDSSAHTLTGFIYKNDQFTYSKTMTFPVLDRIGAGDAYTSGIIHGELSNFATEETVNFALMSAVLTHSTTGDTPLASEKEIFQTMKNGAADVLR